MITRTYFVHAKKHSGSNGSYSYWTCAFEVTSWFPQPVRVYNDTVKRARMELGPCGNDVEITALNRIG